LSPTISSTNAFPQKNQPNLPVISPLLPRIVEDFHNQIVTADFEAIISQDGYNQVYMAAWYNNNKQSIFDVSQWGNNSSTMLEQFWIDLITKNKGRICYFHNWAGYDSILSMKALLSLPGYTFQPIIHNGDIMSLSIFDNKKLVLTIKDSINILPSSLARLAKDYQVETQKDHFPHYFLVEGDVAKTLDYVGSLPDYEFFEPKRTSLAEWEEMAQQFKNREWSFLEVSKQYLMGDCVALFQVLIRFFANFIEQFPNVDPLHTLSAPSLAFKVWRNQQLPLLIGEGFKVYDLSRTLDSTFRKAYCGGIVDVYKPHLLGEGFYYDVNSLYPTAMCRPMPVGMPTPVIITPLEFNQGQFFGFVEATVMSPGSDTNPGYIGLLPIRHEGKLVCPGGTFKGFFFSEELRFALNNGYTLDSITGAYSFQKGHNTFYDLIQTLNNMKVEAQLNNQPTIRNIAKLLMNSLYGRFGMHTDDLKHAILNETQIFKLSKTYIIKDQIPLGSLSLVSYTLNDLSKDFGSNPTKMLSQFVQGLPGYTNVAIAAAVTAYSRIIINQYKLDALNLGLEIFYSDTDSLVVNGALPENVVNSATLGMLKLEQRFSEGIFVMPKVYYLLTEEGKEVMKCKGYSGELTKAQYLNLLARVSI
jgi:hypothetical protein